MTSLGLPAVQPFPCCLGNPYPKGTASKIGLPGFPLKGFRHTVSCDTHLAGLSCLLCKSDRVYHILEWEKEQFPRRASLRLSAVCSAVAKGAYLWVLPLQQAVLKCRELFLLYVPLVQMWDCGFSRTGGDKQQDKVTTPCPLAGNPKQAYTLLKAKLDVFVLKSQVPHSHTAAAGNGFLKTKGDPSGLRMMNSECYFLAPKQ